MFATIFLFLGLLALTLAAPKANEWPIIGVWSQPYYSYDGNCNGECLYIAASYVKYLESAGARVVPIMYNSTIEELDVLFDSINGLFFPGGGADYPKGVQHMYDRAVAANKEGDYFPIWGTCMGFQWMLISASRDTGVLDPKDGTTMDSYNWSIPLDFTQEAKNSRLFKDAPHKIVETLATKNVTMNNHHYGIWTSSFEKNDALTSTFKVLSTNFDKTGKEFVSTIEAYDLPFYASQWHPEKNNFEWGKEADGTPKEAINHSLEAVEVSEYTAKFFVNEARKNFHAFATPAAEDAALIYNYTPARGSGTFVQSYFF